MDIKKIISAVSDVAPTLATALAGPSAGLAVSLVAHMFGADPKNESEIINKIQDDPDAFLKLKQLDAQQAEMQRKYDSEDYKTSVTDIEDARTKELQRKNDWILPLLAISSTLGFFCAMAVIMFTKMDQSDHDVLYIMLGVLGATFNQTFQHYFGKNSK